MKKTTWFSIVMAGMMLFNMVSFAIAEDDAAKPKLILQITVDQLRGDLPMRYLDRLGEGGLRYLLEQGTVYDNAHYQHANTETIVGHVILATGAFPSTSGMVANLWLDRETNEMAYNIEDPRYHMLGGAAVDQDAELDATQKAARTDGRSPQAILVSTFSDELAVSNNGQSKIFGVSVKDRGAVSLAGHAGKAFWFNKSSGEFVTSSFYYDEYPGVDVAATLSAYLHVKYPSRMAGAPLVEVLPKAE